MLARVRQDYAAGAVMAFSGREYVRSEWREVPAGFEEQAKNHELLEVQPSLDEIRIPGLGTPAPEEILAVTVETAETPPAEESPAEETKPAEEDTSKTPRSRRKRAAGE
jgi:hypothetical protein